MRIMLHNQCYEKMKNHGDTAVNLNTTTRNNNKKLMSDTDSFPTTLF
jgi:hypothetical protein